MRRTRAAAALAGIALALAPATAAAADAEITLDLGGAPLVLKLVPRGSFTQGSPPTEPGREPDEAAREVTLSRDLYVGRTPVTRGQFARFVGATGYRSEAEKGDSGGSGWDGAKLVQRKEFTWKTPGFPQADDHPVVLVTYGDAQAFVDWASQQTGRRLRLPTEAEFEYAARAGTKTPWYGGGTEADALAIGWFRSSSPAGGTHPVGQKRANAFGLFDMSGNVYQWCSDFYAPYDAGPATDPARAVAPGGSEPARRVLRGGSWLKEPKRGRSAARYRNTPGSRNADNGFRVVADVGSYAVERASPASGPGSTPASPAAPASKVEVSGGFGDGLGLLAFSAVALSMLGAVTYAVFRVLRGLHQAAVVQRPAGSGPGGGFSLKRVRIEQAPDGFYIRAPGAPAGTRVRYACWIRGVQSQQVAALSGELTFVYTGTRPDTIQILDAQVPAQAGAGRAPSWSNPSRSHSRSSHSSSSSRDPDPFIGFPSAY